MKLVYCVFLTLALFLTISLPSSAAPENASCALNGSDCPVPRGWRPTYNLTQSTIIQPGNTKDYFLPSHPWGLISLDWSVASDRWMHVSSDNVNGPESYTMDQTLMDNCYYLKLKNLAQRCLIYSNCELALEWKESDRSLMKSSRSDLFLGYASGAIYDEPIPSGSQYFWNYTNPMTRSLAVSSIVDGVLLNKYKNYNNSLYIDGVFGDDVSGMPEEHEAAVKNLDMTDSDLKTLQQSTSIFTQNLIDEMATNGKLLWQAFGNRDEVGPAPDASNCLSFMTNLCRKNAKYYWDNKEKSLNDINYNIDNNKNNYLLTMQMDNSKDVEKQRVASFLIVRPPIGYLGWGWESNDSNWNDLFYMNVGEPLGSCENVGSVFSRRYTNGTVSLDCATFSATLPFK